MSFEGKEFTLRSLCLLVVDCPHATPKWTDSGVIVLRNKNIKGGRLDLSSPSFTDEVHYQGRIRRAAPQGGDIVMTREAPMGEVCEIPHGLRCCVGQRQVLLRPNPEKVHGRFLLFALQSTYLQQQIDWNEGTGSTVSNLRIPVLEALRVPTPSLRDQIEIANTLGALDDRIALLRETNATLEAIAQALFKSWFVDFDPVRAKMAGRAPEGMDEATAALFPAEFEESGQRLTPKGWIPTAVADVCSVVKGKSYSSRDLVETCDTALVTLKSFERGGGFRMDGFKPYAGTYKQNQVVEPGDLIVAYTDVTQAAELIGKPAIVVGVPEYNRLVASLDVGIIRIDASRASKQFLYGLFQTDEFQSHTLAHTSGTTVLHLAKEAVGSFVFVRPQQQLVCAFDEFADAISARRQTNSDQIRLLTTLRDTLLPRLISGQLRLPLADTQPAIAPLARSPAPV